MSNPTCSGCGEPITSVVLEAFGMTWHPYHLCCNTCGKDFSDGTQPDEGEDGFAYCSPCFVKAFSTICAECEQIVEGEVVNAVEKSFHPECFVCRKCKAALGDTFFPGPDGFPYCKQHYFEIEGRICAECEKPIVIGKVVSFMDKKYHMEHFVCKLCKKHLGDAGYKEHDKKPYCKPCWTKLYG